MKTTRGQLDGATKWALLAGLALALAAAGCARVGPPGGGPEDTTPPEIVSTEPADGATEVTRDASLRLVFSEDMDRVSAERAFSVEPGLEFRNLRWDGDVLVARIDPGIVVPLHHMTIGTCLGSVAQIAGTFAITEGERSDSAEDAQQDGERRGEPLDRAATPQLP